MELLLAVKCAGVNLEAILDALVDVPDGVICVCSHLCDRNCTRAWIAAGVLVFEPMC